MKVGSSITLATMLAVPIAACQRDGTRTPETGIAATSAATVPDMVARGDYLVRTAGCNDCHTHGYADQKGNVDRALWLTGSPVGFKGPWGTTYPTNLRLSLASMDEERWLEYSGTLQVRPLMPDFALRAMTLEDRRAIYQLVRSLGPGGGPAPAYLPPEQSPSPPYFDLVLPPPSSQAAGQR